MLQKKRKHVDNTDLMVEINRIINESITVEAYRAEVFGEQETSRYDISGINFELLRTEFAKRKHKNLLLKDIQEYLEQELDKSIGVNPQRIDYYERYQQIIEAYNAEQDRATIEQTFMDLMNLAKDLSEEEQRYAREGFENEEELSIFDLLFKENLSAADIKKIKKVAVNLLTKVKKQIKQLDHWADKIETKATVDNLIRDTLWNELPESYDELSISEYRQKIYNLNYS